MRSSLPSTRLAIRQRHRDRFGERIWGTWSCGNRRHSSSSSALSGQYRTLQSPHIGIFVAMPARSPVTEWHVLHFPGPLKYAWPAFASPTKGSTVFSIADATANREAVYECSDI